MHIILKPGKSNGASLERKRAGWIDEVIKWSSFSSETFYNLILRIDIPIKGLNVNGDTMLARELMPEMHPWAFPL